MNRVNRRTISALIIIFCSLLSGAGPLSAQIGIDVKTKWSEKKELTVLKHGVIGALDLSVRFKSVEFGEDYALWLRDAKRRPGNGDTVMLELALEVREASLFQEGELIASGTVTIAYDRRTLDSIGNDPDLLRRASDYQGSYEMLNGIVAATVTALVPKAKPLVQPLVGLLLQEFNGPPDLHEICEATLVGAQVVMRLQEMLEAS